MKERGSNVLGEIFIPELQGFQLKLR